MQARVIYNAGNLIESISLKYYSILYKKYLITHYRCDISYTFLELFIKISIFITDLVISIKVCTYKKRGKNTFKKFVCQKNNKKIIPKKFRDGIIFVVVMCTFNEADSLTHIDK